MAGALPTDARSARPRYARRMQRCWWPGDDALYLAYHDDEWGRPVKDDRRLFEKLCLEGFQSGLSWLTILKKREAFRRAFSGFDFEKVARFGPQQIEQLMADASIVRHRKKIEAAIHNAQQACELVEREGSLAAYFWRFEPPLDERPARVTREVLVAMPTSPTSTRMAKDLKKRGFRFFGPTTAYAFMQAMGIVNDHIEGCFAREQVEEERARFVRPA